MSLTKKKKKEEKDEKNNRKKERKKKRNNNRNKIQKETIDKETANNLSQMVKQRIAQQEVPGSNPR